MKKMILAIVLLVGLLPMPGCRKESWEFGFQGGFQKSIRMVKQNVYELDLPFEWRNGTDKDLDFLCYGLSVDDYPTIRFRSKAHSSGSFEFKADKPLMTSKLVEFMEFEFHTMIQGTEEVLGKTKLRIDFVSEGSDFSVTWDDGSIKKTVMTDVDFVPEDKIVLESKSEHELKIQLHSDPSIEENYDVPLNPELKRTNQDLKNVWIKLKPFEKKVLPLFDRDYEFFRWNEMDKGEYKLSFTNQADISHEITMVVSQPEAQWDAWFEKSGTKSGSFDTPHLDSEEIVLVVDSKSPFVTKMTIDSTRIALVQPRAATRIFLGKLPVGSGKIKLEAQGKTVEFDYEVTGTAKPGLPKLHKLCQKSYSKGIEIYGAAKHGILASNGTRGETPGIPYGSGCGIMDENGDFKWSLSYENRVSGLFSNDDSIMFIDGHLKCVSQTDGKLKWKVEEIDDKWKFVFQGDRFVKFASWKEDENGYPNKPIRMAWVELKTGKVFNAKPSDLDEDYDLLLENPYSDAKKKLIFRKNGEVIWEKNRNDFLADASSSVSPLLDYTINEGKLFVTFTDEIMNYAVWDKVVCYDLYSGKRLWAINDSFMSFGASQKYFAILEYGGDEYNKILKLYDANTGNLIASTKTFRSKTDNGLAIFGDRIYINHTSWKGNSDGPVGWSEMECYQIK